MLENLLWGQYHQGKYYINVLWWQRAFIYLSYNNFIHSPISPIATVLLLWLSQIYVVVIPLIIVYMRTPCQHGTRLLLQPTRLYLTQPHLVKW